MPKRRRKTLPKTHIERLGAPWPQNDCRALVPLDTGAVRARLLRERATLERTLWASEALWKQYVEVDQPAYRRWRHAVGGTLRADLERVAAECRCRVEAMAALDNLCDAHRRPMEWALKRLIGHVVVVTNCSVAELNKLQMSDWLAHLDAFLAKEFASLDRKQQAARSKADTAEGTGDDGSRDDDPFGAVDDAFREFIESFMGGFSGDDCDDDESGGFSGSRRARRAETRAQKVATRSVRSLYRELCRKLHPDAAGAYTPARRALWEQVQQAYAGRDAQALEALLARLELEVDPLGAQQAAPSRLAALVQHLKRGLNAARAMVARGKREVDWNFTGWPEAKRRREEGAIRADLKRDCRAMQAEAEELEFLFFTELEPQLRAMQRPRKGASSGRSPKARPTESSPQAIFDWF